MRKSALAAAGMLVVSSFVWLGSGTASASAVCNQRPPTDIDHSSHLSATKDAQLFNGSHTTCHVNGPLTKGNTIDYFCFTINPQSETSWTYLWDHSNGGRGWVQDKYLPNNGSGIYCGF